MRLVGSNVISTFLCRWEDDLDLLGFGLLPPPLLLLLVRPMIVVDVRDAAAKE